MKKPLFLLLISFITCQLFAQTSINGKVTDKSGTAMPGVNIVLKGTNQGTVSDLEGNYTFSNVPSDAILVFSFLGYVTQEIPINGRTVVDLVLEEDIKSLEDVVVIGYGSVKRANLTGAVVDMRGGEIEDIPVTSLSTALEGRMAGVRVNIPSGKPGLSPTLRIRTESNFADRGKELPLFVIDGVITEEQADFDRLDISEIESISVLKDAAAAVYGTRATGGVVVVTTKRGKKGKPILSYTSNYGIGVPTNIPEMMNSKELATFYNEILSLAEDDPYFPYRVSPYDYYAEDELEYFEKSNYNWLDPVWHNSVMAKQALNVSGGSETVNYFVGGTYVNESGSMDNLFAHKYTLRTNVDAKITKELKASLSMSFNRTDNKQPNFASEKNESVLGDTYKQTLTGLPWIPPVINGLPVDNMVNNNPYGLILSNSYKNGTDNRYNLQAALEYEVPFVKGLKLKVQYSRHENFERSKDYTQDYKLYNFPVAGSHRHIVVDTLPPKGYREYSNSEGLSEKTSTKSNYQLNASVNYSKTMGKHEVSGLFLYEQSEGEDEMYWTRVRAGAAVPGYEYLWAYNKAEWENGSSAHEDGRLAYLGRFNYSFAQKYLFEATFRYEASDKFSPQVRWGLFPAISGGWVVSQESFFKDNVSFINFMKLRASAGRVGNDNLNIDQWKQLFDGDKGGAIFAGNPSNGISPKQYGLYTPYLTWQKSNSYNAGMDVRFLEGHLVLGTDYYYRFTYDLFERRTSEMPTSLGINTTSERLPQENHGEMEVRGVEIELGYNNNFRNEVTYYIKGHFSWDKRKILKKIQNPAVIGTWKDELLISPDNQQGLICLGVLNTQAEIDALLEEHPNYRIYDNEKYIEPQLGMLYYQDVRGNKYTDSITGRYAYTAPNDTIHLEWDRTIIAEHNTPPFNYGFSFGFGWKGIRLDMFFTGAFGHKVFVDKEEQALPNPDGGVENVFAFWNDYWSPENPDAAYPRPYNYGFDKQYSTFWMRDGHTLRLTTLNINYTLPKNISDRLRVQKLRVYFTGRNLWTVISPFDFKDPSVSSAYDYPMMKLYNFGVNITI